MSRLLPLLFALGVGYLLWHFSAWRTLRELNGKSSDLADARLLEICDRLAAALGVQAVPVRVYEVPEVNGLAAPDGQIFLTRGFYERYRSGAVTAEEMASVIAHELGHVALGHARRRMIDFSAQNAMRAVLVAIASRLVPGFGAWLGEGITRLLAARLSRQDEYEADAYAAALLAKAGIGSGPQISLFRKMAALAGSGHGPAWLASHPATRERIAAVERLVAGWGA
ncbi:M48 family metalloprotease [Solirhodobacter olei]|uniref:M48 family metalloprotease n=1 Tax=Solirhodobacter olei TaxID=2493082 RepID=UPI000FD90028|nr:M48 family metalloprotease [Solirhodobacter olei]